jgi:RNA polymerase sigma factor (sigma-70 family)
LNSYVDDAERRKQFEAAFPALFLSAYRVAFHVLGDAAEAEDAAAEALARSFRAWRRIGQLPYRDAWVSRVAANVAIDRVRRRPAPAATTSDVVADFADAATLRIALSAALLALPRRQREVVALRYLGGFTEADVAGSLGLSLNTVKKHTQRGTSALRACLGSDWQEASNVVE